MGGWLELFRNTIRIGGSELVVRVDVKTTYVRYRIERCFELEEFGPLGDVSLQETTIRCAAPWQSPYSSIKLDQETIETLGDTIKSGDYVKAYIIALESIQGITSKMLSEGAYLRSDLERNLLLLSKIKRYVSETIRIDDKDSRFKKRMIAVGEMAVQL